jgi:signal transduction histidine kinase
MTQKDLSSSFDQQNTPNEENDMSFAQRFLEWIKNLQYSLFLWFAITYGFIYLVSLFATKDLYTKFERNFDAQVSQEAYRNRTELFQTMADSFDTNQTNNLKIFIENFDAKQNDPSSNTGHIVSVLLDKKASDLLLPNHTRWPQPHPNLLLECVNKTTSCPNGLLTKSQLGLPPSFPFAKIAPSLLHLKEGDMFLLHFSNKTNLHFQMLPALQITERLSQLIVFLTFLSCIGVSYAAVRPIHRFVQKIKNQKLDSALFMADAPYEFNHIRVLRLTIYHLLLRKEAEERERLAMQQSLIAQQKEAEIGKIVSQISHDLKSPLVIFENLLQENSYENFSDNLEPARRSFNKIMALVSSLKQADKESLIGRTTAPFDVQTLLDEAKAYAKSKHLHFKATLSLPHTPLLLDHTKVERSLNNLLRNAVEYARSKVELNIHLRNDTLEIDVFDDGAGVPSNVLPKLFQWRNTGNLESGTGIGLYYARQIALAHGGNLTYAHTSQQTRFHMTITGVQEGQTKQTSPNPIAAKPQIQALHTDAGKSVIFFIKNQEKRTLFQNDVQINKLNCAFFHERTPEFERTPCRTLYTDSEEAILERFIDSGVHIILAKRSDTPELVAQRISIVNKN